jgi:fatty-acyl-CoA synthase
VSIADILVRAVSDFGGSTAIVDRDRRFTYTELAARAGSLAAALSRLGIGRGDRIAVVAQNSHEFVEAYFAAAAAAAILVPINTRLTAREVGQILKDSGARAIISSSMFSGQILEATGSGGTAVETALWIDPKPGARS